MSRLEPVEYSIYSSRLQLACRESREILKRIGISSFIKSGDVAHGVYTPNGDLAIADVGTYLHVVTGMVPIKYVLKHYATDPSLGLSDGDIFFCNEAIYGGIHNPDMINFMPVFSSSELVAWVAVASHEPETGAMVPGGMPNAAKSRYDEGLKVPPLRTGENFKLRKDITALFENNVRYPLLMSNDQSARVAACLRIRKRVLEIVEKKGTMFLSGLLRKVIVNTSEAVKNRVRLVPDGTFRHVTFLDTIGSSEGLVRFPVELKKKGEGILFDLSHASPQVPGSYNAFEHALHAALASLVFQYFLNDLPASSGCLVPFEFKTTKGSCLNPALDAAISNCTLLMPSVINAIQICLIKALYGAPEFRKDEYVSLPMSCPARALVLSGENQWGRHVTDNLIFIGNSKGGGARPDKDGVDSIGFYYAGYVEAMDCELYESHLPVVTLWRKFAVDGGGQGKFRGGTGVSYAFIIANAPETSMVGHGTHHRFPTCGGVFGGYPGETRPRVILRNAYERRSSGELPMNEPELVQKYSGSSDLLVIPSASSVITLKEGDLVFQCSGGGGGYGDPLDRDPNMVLRDVKRRRISTWCAENVYKVSLDDSGTKVNLTATKERREAELKARLRRAKSWDEFSKEWEQKRPPESALSFYGKWPIPD